ncbi:MAG: PAS domain S-box protein [candidate division Zixibacteria bacterium]|nr:PAS domain S-box protein [candidate division Zixibacteria bacterium]
MKVQTKFILLMLFLFIFFSGGLFLSKHLQKEQNALLFQDRSKEKDLLLNMTIDFRGATLRVLANDYSLWDDMVNFVKTGDRDWANINIKMSLKTYNANAVWVCRPDLSVVYSCNNLNTEALDNLPLPREASKRVLSKNPFYYFFAWTAGGLMEIRTAPIQPALDIERKTQPQGYFMAGQIWNNDYIKELSGLTQSQIELFHIGAGGAPPGKGDINEGTIRSVKILNGWDGKPLAQVASQSAPSILQELNQQSNRRFILILAVAVITLTVILFPLLHWVNNPLRLLFRSLNSGDPLILKQLQREKNEFGHLAQLIIKSFGQYSALIKEVMERTLAEKALRENENYLKTLLDSINSGIMVVESTTHKIVDANLCALRMMGAVKEEVIGHECYEFVCRNEMGKCPISDFGKTVDYSEQEIRRIDGEKLPIFRSVVPVSRNGEKYLIESFLDITERKKAEEELRESTRRLAELAEEQRLLLDNTRDFIYRHDTHGVMYYISPSVEQITGYSPADWCAHYTKYMTDNSINMKVVEYTDETLRMGTIHPAYLVEIYHKDGRRIMLEVKEQPYYEGDRVDGIVGVARDVTDSKIVEQQLRHSEERYRYLIENISDGVAIVDLDENVIYANPAACHIFGYGLEELLKMNLNQIAVENEFAKIRAETEKRKRQEASHYEFDIRRKDGELRRLFLTAKPFFD